MLLREGDARITDLAASAPMTFAGISRHVGVLEDAGLIRREVRGREHWFSVRPEGSPDCRGLDPRAVLVLVRARRRAGGVPDSTQACEVIDPDGAVHIIGEYLELDPPNRLRFTWTTSFDGGFDSLVTVTLRPYGTGQTMMTIEHTQLPPQWSSDHHRGWTRIAGQLEARLTARH